MPNEQFRNRHLCAGRLSGMVHRKPDATALVSYSFAPNGQGRIISFAPPDGSVSYSYDANGHETVAGYSWTGDEGYSHDNAGDSTQAVTDHFNFTNR